MPPNIDWYAIADRFGVPVAILVALAVGFAFLLWPFLVDKVWPFVTDKVWPFTVKQWEDLTSERRKSQELFAKSLERVNNQREDERKDFVQALSESVNVSRKAYSSMEDLTSVISNMQNATNLNTESIKQVLTLIESEKKRKAAPPKRRRKKP